MRWCYGLQRGDVGPALEERIGLRQAAQGELSVRAAFAAAQEAAMPSSKLNL